jgi:hypothetical protein
VCVLSPSRLCKYRSGRHTDLDIGALVLLPRRILRMCGYAASIIGAATTADQQGGIQILILVLWCCHHGGSTGRNTDLEDVRLRRSAAQLLLVRLRRILLALLRSSYWRCYAAIIGAATQLFWRCHHGWISRGVSEKGKGCGLGARAARSTRRKTQKNANEMCLCVQSSRL